MATYNVAYLSAWDKVRFERMQKLAPANVSVKWVDPKLPDQELIAQLRDVDAVVGYGGRVTPALAKSCPRLQFVQVLSAGYDSVDVVGLGELGIRVANNGGANAVSVSEHAISLMLAAYRRLMDAWHNTVKLRKWRQGIETLPPRSELTGKTVGIIGLGHIGQEVAKRLQGFQTITLYYDTRTFTAKLEKELKVKRTALDDLLRQSDIVTIHVPLMRSTRKLVGERELSLMKPTAVLINTCRGPVVDEKALYKALKEKRIAAAGLDVLEQEPTPPDNPILDLDNVVVTPHWAGGTIESIDRSVDFAMENFKRLSAGKEPESVVVPE